MKQTLENLGLCFGREHIAANGNFYRVAKPTEQFWDFYKENKTELKNAGYSVYKHSDYGFCVYDWTNKTPATADEIAQYNQEKQDYEAAQLRDSVNSFAIEVEERSTDEVANCETWEDLRNEVERICENPSVYWHEVILPNKKLDFYWT